MDTRRSTEEDELPPPVRRAARYPDRAGGDRPAVDLSLKCGHAEQVLIGSGPGVWACGNPNCRALTT